MCLCICEDVLCFFALVLGFLCVPVCSIVWVILCVRCFCLCMCLFLFFVFVCVPVRHNVCAFVFLCVGGSVFVCVGACVFLCASVCVCVSV